MTDNEWYMISLLFKQCTFIPGSFDKRFVRDIHANPNATLSDKQHACLERLFYRYRRQTGLAHEYQRLKGFPGSQCIKCGKKKPMCSQDDLCGFVLPA